MYFVGGSDGLEFKVGEGIANIAGALEENFPDERLEGEELFG